MRRLLNWIVIIIFVGGLLFVSGYFTFIHILGHNFVHKESTGIGNDSAAAPSVWQPQRASIASKYKEYELDTLLNQYLRQHPQYQLPDTIQLPDLIECGCNCLDFRKEIYFSGIPKEVYVVTYTTENDPEVVIDVKFMLRKNKWECSKSFLLDSIEKGRIINRLQDEVLSKLN